VPSQVEGLKAPKVEPLAGSKIKGIGTVPINPGELTGKPVRPAVLAKQLLDAVTEAGVTPGKVNRAKSADVPSAASS